ncbi:MAG: hypothetical protein IJU26_06940 [Synergistaceae bacterium]|nr:hypothetical protein [Synergistaceae bacterium]
MDVTALITLSSIHGDVTELIMSDRHYSREFYCAYVSQHSRRCYGVDYVRRHLRESIAAVASDRHYSREVTALASVSIHGRLSHFYVSVKRSVCLHV